MMPEVNFHDFKIKDYNDGKDKHQSQEREISFNISSNSCYIYGGFNLTLYGSDIEEVNGYQNLTIDSIIKYLETLKIKEEKKDEENSISIAN